MRRVAVIGLDSAPADLVLRRWRRELPTLSALMSSGSWGVLRSCDPPITVPAWASMLSGYDPGRLGIYGFRDRGSFAYGDLRLATSSSVREPRVWDHLAKAGRRSILVGVPQTYPPPVIDGWLVSCFLTPTKATVWSHPAELGGEIVAACGEVPFDVEDFRGHDREALLGRIYDKTQQDFAVSRHLLATRDWDFFMMVVMGTDRIQHAFWPADDESVDASGGWEVLRRYYRFVDAQIARLLELLGDDTVVIVVSDHGAKRMSGGICLNEWLAEHGLLALNAYPPGPQPLRPEMVDWARTKVWAEGGYCGRLFVNVRGREPEGCVAPEDYERVRDDVIAAIATIEDRDGVCLHSPAHRPEELYGEVRGIAPDLVAYLGNLDWRALGSVGHGRVVVDENDTGPDGANHDWEGIYIARERCGAEEVELRDLAIADVAPTLLRHYDNGTFVVPQDLCGTAIDPRRRWVGNSSGAAVGRG